MGVIATLIARGRETGNGNGSQAGVAEVEDMKSLVEIGKETGTENETNPKTATESGTEIETDIATVTAHGKKEATTVMADQSLKAMIKKGLEPMFR